jgi:hypothetical protein
MKGQYEINKTSIMKWRDNNKEVYNLYVNKYMTTVYAAKNNENKKRRYKFNKECERMRNILLCDVV